MLLEDIITGRDIHIPNRCEKCGSMDIEYRGVGEYKCKNCGYIMYDDYGKVRNYLEKHVGATSSQVAEATNVPINTIRQFLKDEKLEVSPKSAVFMMCEVCGSPIRSGRYCENCLKRTESSKGTGHSNNSGTIRGYGSGRDDASGEMRYNPRRK